MFTSIHLLLTLPFPSPLPLLFIPGTAGSVGTRVGLVRVTGPLGRGRGQENLAAGLGEGVGMDQKQGLAVSRLTLSPLPVTPRQVQ